MRGSEGVKKNRGASSSGCWRGKAGFRTWHWRGIRLAAHRSGSDLVSAAALFLKATSALSMLPALLTDVPLGRDCSFTRGPCAWNGKSWQEAWTGISSQVNPCVMQNRLCRAAQEWYGTSLKIYRERRKKKKGSSLVLEHLLGLETRFFFLHFHFGKVSLKWTRNVDVLWRFRNEKDWNNGSGLKTVLWSCK